MAEEEKKKKGKTGDENKDDKRPGAGSDMGSAGKGAEKEFDDLFEDAPLEPEEEGDLKMGDMPNLDEVQKKTPPENEKSFPGKNEAPLKKEGPFVEKKEESSVEQKVQPIEGEVVEDSGEHLGGHVDPPLDKTDFKQEFWDILEQAGISKQKFFGILIGLGVFVFFLIIFIWGWGRFFSDRDEVIVPDDDVLVVVDLAGPGIYSVVSSFIFGLEYAKDVDPGIIGARPVGAFAELSSFEAAFALGDIDVERFDRLIHYIELLRKMQNIYVTDVYALMDASVDRRTAVRDHLRELNDLIEDGIAAVEEIDLYLGQLSDEYDVVAERRDSHELSFFANLQDLRGVRAQDNLDDFINFAQVANKLRAEYSATVSVRRMLVNSVNALDPRHRAVEANEEALVQGVRVFDVPGADIDAIIRLD